MVVPQGPNIVQPIVMLTLVALQMSLTGVGLCAWLRPWEDKCPADTFWMRLFFCCTLGMAVDTVLLFLLGATGFLTLTPVLALLVAVALPGVWFLWRGKEATGGGFGSVSRMENVTLLATLVALVALCAAEGIRVPGLWDDTTYHLPLARHYMQEGALTLDLTVRFPLFPQHMDLWFSLGLMLGGSGWGGELLAQMLAVLPLILASMGLMAASAWRMGSPLYGAVCMLGLWHLFLFRFYIGFAMVDMGVALFCWTNLLALALCLDAQSASARFRWLMVAAIMCGMAAGTKYFGLACVFFASGLFFLLLYFELRQNPSRNWRQFWWWGLAYVAVSFFVGGGWYVRSWILSGNPVHPVASSLFGHFLLNPEDLYILSLEQASHGVPKTIGNLYAALAKLNLEFLAVVPLALLFYRRISRGILLIVGTCIVYYVFWFTQTQVDRYIYPVVISGMFLLCWMLHQILVTLCAPAARFVQSRLVNECGSFAVVFFLCWLAVAPLPQRLVQWQALLGQREGYELFAAAGQRNPSKNATLVQIGFENALYFFPGKALGDQFGLVPYRTLVEGHVIQNKAFTLNDYMFFLGANFFVSPPEKMVDFMKSFNARLLIVKTQYFNIDLAAYEKFFTVLMQNANGVLLELKSSIPTSEAE